MKVGLTQCTSMNSPTSYREKDTNIIGRQGEREMEGELERRGRERRRRERRGRKEVGGK